MLSLYLYVLLPASIETGCLLKKDIFYHYHVFQGLLQSLCAMFGDLSKLKLLLVFLQSLLIHYFDDCCLFVKIRSKFECEHKNHEVKNCGKNCVSCPYLLKASLYQFKRVNKTFLLKNSLNCDESSNLIHVFTCQGCKEEYTGETGCIVKERINIYRQHIRQPQYQQLAVEEHVQFVIFNP